MRWGHEKDSLTHTSIAAPILLSNSFRVATADLASLATLCAKAVSCGVPVVSWVCKYRRAYDTSEPIPVSELAVPPAELTSSYCSLLLESPASLCASLLCELPFFASRPVPPTSVARSASVLLPVGAAGSRVSGAGTCRGCRSLSRDDARDCDKTRCECGALA